MSDKIKYMSDKFAVEIGDLVFHYSNNVIPINIALIHLYPEDAFAFVNRTVSVLKEDFHETVEEIKRIAYEEGFNQGQEFAKNQENGFN